MSAIAGIYVLDGRPVDCILLERMVESLTHRGPDGGGFWTEGSVGLGHRMLWTTPESLKERQPMLSEDGGLCLTADARVDNRDELKAELEAKGIRLRTDTDAELILQAYEVWGEDCPRKILGDFAFALWDGRRRRLFCARDPIGIKPFFYFFDGKTFGWASEPKAIFEDGTIPREPNLTLICLYLLGRFDEREETLYRDVYRLPPAHYMVLEGGHLRKAQYWDIDPGHMIRYQTDAEYAEHFLSLFREAVRTRLRSHGPVGALLSGGLDSSSIVCTAQRLFQEGVIPNNGFETFSIVFDELPCDERSYIDEVVRQWDMKANHLPHEQHLSWLDFEQAHLYPDVGYFPNIFMNAPSFRSASQKGIRIMLSGSGGDELFVVGVDRLTDLMRQGSLRKLMVQLRRDVALSLRSPFSLFFTYCLRPLIPGPVKAALRPLLKPSRGNGIPSWVNAACLREMGVYERLRTERRGTQFPTRAQQRIYNVLVYGWSTNIARDMMERLAAHFCTESRYPFFDRRLVEFLLAVPEEQRWCGEWIKALLRRAMEGILPEPIRTRKGKAEFSPVIYLELKHRQAHKVEALLRTSTLAALGVLHADQLPQLFEEYRRGMAPKDARIFERIVWLELWCRSAVDRPKKEVKDDD